MNSGEGLEILLQNIFMQLHCEYLVTFICALPIYYALSKSIIRYLPLNLLLSFLLLYWSTTSRRGFRFAATTNNINSTTAITTTTCYSY